jgi:hypothetical protein
LETSGKIDAHEDQEVHGRENSEKVMRDKWQVISKEAAGDQQLAISTSEANISPDFRFKHLGATL